MWKSVYCRKLQYEWINKRRAPQQPFILKFILKWTPSGIKFAIYFGLRIFQIIFKLVWFEFFMNFVNIHSSFLSLWKHSSRIYIRFSDYKLMKVEYFWVYFFPLSSQYVKKQEKNDILKFDFCEVSWG